MQSVSSPQKSQKTGQATVDVKGDEFRHRSLPCLPALLVHLPAPGCDKNLSFLVHQRWQSALCEWGLLEAPVSLPVTGFQQRPILSIDHTATAWQWINNTSENG
jgi:hypothetical protein